MSSDTNYYTQRYCVSERYYIYYSSETLKQCFSELTNLSNFRADM